MGLSNFIQKKGFYLRWLYWESVTAFSVDGECYSIEVLIDTSILKIIFPST